MGIKSVIRKIAELGVGITAITVLVLAGCGGGGGSTTATPVSNSVLLVAPSMGWFNSGTHIHVRDRNGSTADGVIDSTGHAPVTVTGLTAPLLVSVLPDNTNTIYFYDEKLGPQSMVLPTGTAAIRSLIPNVPAPGVTTPVGVTPLTEMAVGYIAAQPGGIAGATPALANAAASAVGAFFGMSAADVLSAPTIIGPSSVPLTDLTSQANIYALKLAALANMATTGNNALNLSQALTSSFQTGTFGTGLAASGIINGVTVSTTALPTSTFSATLTAAMAAAAGNASQVSATAASNLTTVVATVPTAPPASVTQQISDTVGGPISGLIGSVILQDNGGDNLNVTANGTFTFATPVANGSAYNVSVLTQPSGETCSVSRGAGTISGSNVTNVTVVCSVNPMNVGGTVSGLAGSVVLQDNGGDNLTVMASGSFTFATKVASGSPYSVTVLSQPTGQSCSVGNGTGTISLVNVTNVTVNCSTNTYTIGGTVSGLTGTGSVVLQDNSGDNTTVSTNGGFTFPTAVAFGNHYGVTILTQPSGQTCNVTAGAGTVGAGNISNVAVACAALAPITNAKALLTSLRTNVNVLGNTNKNGFLQNQATAVQADFTASTGAFGEDKDFLKIAANAVGLLRSGVGAGTSVYPVGYMGVCMVQFTGTVVCQWMKQNTYGATATHQLTVTGPTGSPGTTSLPTSGSPLIYSWADAIISNTDLSNGLPTSVGITLPTVATTGVTTRPLIPTTSTPNPTTSSPAYGPAIGTLTVAVGSTGTLTFTNGNINAGSSANITFNGYILPSALSPSATGVKTDHSSLNVTVTLSAAYDVATVTILQGKVGFNSGSNITRVDTSGNIVNQLVFGSGSSVVEEIGTGVPVSINLALTAKTPNYSFGGSVGMSGFAQDANPICLNLACTSTGNWYPQTTTFTGSVAGINTNSSLGPFMTTTGTGLVVNVNRTPSGSYLGFDPSQPTGCPNSLANCNYQIVNGAFSGNVVNGSLTYQITNLAVSNGNTLTGPGVGTLSLTYTDPHSGAVTVSITGTSASVPASGTATLGTTGIAIVMGTGGIGNIYSGYTGSTSTATLIGTISGGMVYFIDGTTQSL